MLDAIHKLHGVNFIVRIVIRISYIQMRDSSAAIHAGHDETHEITFIQHSIVEAEIGQTCLRF